MSAVSSVEAALLQVTVSVASTGQIVCSPDPLSVVDPDTTISFVLSDPHWVFPATDAVVVSNGGAQFPEPARSVSDRLVTLLDLNTASGSFAYTVTVRHAVTGVVRSIDPTIRNDG